MNRHCLLLILSLLLLAIGCAPKAHAPVDYVEDASAKRLLQGIWIDDETQEVNFMVKGDTIFYPDSTSQPARFKVVGDTIAIGEPPSRYPIVKLTENLFVFKNQNGEELRLSKSDSPDDNAAFEHRSTMVSVVSEVQKRDTVVTFSNERYHWKLRNVTIRDMHTNREIIRHYPSLDSVIFIEPRDIMISKHMEETMTNEELRDQIEKQRIRGNGHLAQFEIEYHKRFASPFASFILSTIGLSLSAKKRKNGMGLALGTGLALSASYILLQTISASFSINAGLPPIIAAWLPNLLFTLIAAYLYRKAPR